MISDKESEVDEYRREQGDKQMQTVKDAWKG